MSSQFKLLKPALLLPMFLALVVLLSFSPVSADEKNEGGQEKTKQEQNVEKNGKQHQGPNPEVPQKWVEIRVNDGAISMSVDGPGVSVSPDWAVFSVRSNSRVRVDVRPDCYLTTKDGLTLGKATSPKGDTIGYELLVRPWHPKRGHHRYHSPLHYCNIHHWRLIGLGALVAGNYTTDRSMAKPGKYKGTVLITTSVEN